jgi:MoxR-like ATPase
LLNKTTDPSEIFGPHSLKAMERDQFLRKTDGFLPEAHIAYLDEIWKANSPVLNLLLPIINEREFVNDGKKINIPLLTMFASSNEYPED